MCYDNHDYLEKNWSSSFASANVRALIKLSCYTQKAFAQKYHIPLRTIENWCSGVTCCPLYVYELLQFRVRTDMIQERRDLKSKGVL